MMDGAKVRGLLQANQRLIDGETPGDSSLQKSHTHFEHTDLPDVWCLPVPSQGPAAAIPDRPTLSRKWH